MTATTPTPRSMTGFSRQVECLRRRLTDWGWPTDEIAAAIGAQFRLRPRVAYRYAAGLSGQKAADAYNARFGTAERAAPMSKTRISEYENWPIGRNTRKPSLTVLDNLAQLYGTTRRRLTDHHDWAALPDPLRRALHTVPEPSPRPVPQVTSGAPSRCADGPGRRPPQPFAWISPGGWTTQAEGHLIMAAASQAGEHAGRSGAGTRRYQLRPGIPTSRHRTSEGSVHLRRLDRPQQPLGLRPSSPGFCHCELTLTPNKHAHSQSTPQIACWLSDLRYLFISSTTTVFASSSTSPSPASNITIEVDSGLSRYATKTAQPSTSAPPAKHGSRVPTDSATTSHQPTKSGGTQDIPVRINIISISPHRSTQ